LVSVVTMKHFLEVSNYPTIEFGTSRTYSSLKL
jgi:polyisoprenoid-binding protein YceI